MAGRLSGRQAQLGAGGLVRCAHLLAAPALCLACATYVQAANSVTVVPGSFTQGMVRSSMSGNAYAQLTNNGVNKLDDWPLTTGGRWPVTITNSDYAASTLIAFGDGGGITLQFDQPIHPVANAKEFGIFTAQMLNAGSGGYLNGNMEAALLVSANDVDWYTLDGQAITNPTTYTATSYQLNAPVVSYDFQNAATAWSYGSSGAPSTDTLNALAVADYQTPMPDDDLFNSTGTNGQRLALRTDAATATYDAIFGTSGGGNWFDISNCGLSNVAYLRLNAVNCGGTSGGIRLDAVFSTPSAVPEPAALPLLAGSLLLQLRRRRR